MTVLVQKPAPGFCTTAILPDNRINANFKLEDYRGKYVVLFFYPLDFTFVCPTEIIAFDHRLDEFKNRNVEIIGISIDSHYSHLAWKNTPVEKGGIGKVQYPLVADLDKSISRNYGVLTETQSARITTGGKEFETTTGGKVALRASFLIDKQGIVRHQVVNDLPLGRNIDEMLRMVDALQHFEKVGEVCPAGWEKGHAGMHDTPAGVAEYLADHAHKL